MLKKKQKVGAKVFETAKEIALSKKHIMLFTVFTLGSCLERCYQILHW